MPGFVVAVVHDMTLEQSVYVTRDDAGRDFEVNPRHST